MPNACLFCSIATGAASAHIVGENDDVVAFLDVRPLFHGHTLVVPRSHHVTLPDLPDDEVGPFFTAVRSVTVAVREAMEAQGTFVALNNVVSQSVAHLHVHVVPRSKGDGLRGFFWPRTSYPSDSEMVAVADLIRARVGERL